MSDRERAYAVLTGAACLASGVVLALAAGVPTVAGIASMAAVGAASGLVGNVSDRVMCRALRTIAERMRDTSRPLNHDLARAVRIAQLQAIQTLLGEHERSELCRLNESGWDRSADLERAQWARLVKEVNSWCDREKSIRIPTLDDVTAKVLSERINGLLKEPSGGDTSIRIKGLWSEALAAVLAELQKAVGNLPASFVARLEDPDDGWRAVARLLFAESYKSDGKVFAVMVVELLGTLQAHLEGLQLQNARDHAELVALVEQHHKGISTSLLEQCGELGARFTEALNQLRKDLDARPAHAELRLRVGDVQVKLDELLRSDQRSAQKIARQDQTLRMLLMMLMREEASRRGQPIDGRFGIAAEDVNRLIETKSALLIGRATALADLDLWVKDQPTGVRFLSAAAGVGKTSLLASWMRMHEAMGDRVVRHFFSRNFPETIATESALEHLLRQLRCQLGHRAESASDDVKSTKDRIHHLLEQSQESPLLVILDGLDEAEESLPAFLPGALGQGVYVVVGVRQTDPAIPPRIVRNWCRVRAQKEWADLPASNAEWTRVQLPPIDEPAIEEWMGHALPSLEPPEHRRLVKPLLRTSEGIPLFAGFLIDDLKKRRLQAVDLAIAPSFHEFAERELQAFADVGQPVHPLFALMTLIRAPISELELSRIMEHQRIDIPETLTRWFLITGDRRNLLYAFSHPRLAQVFAETIAEADRERALHRLKIHAGRWAQPGNDYALRYGIAHLTSDESPEAIKLLWTIDFHALRFQRFPNWDGLSDSLALAQRLPLTSNDQQWLAGLAQCQLVLSKLKPSEREPQLRGLAADWLGEPSIPGRMLALAHPVSPKPSALVRVLVASCDGALELTDGQVLSWGHEGSLLLWDLGNADSVEWSGHSSTVCGALQLTDGQVLTWHFDESLRLWDPSTADSIEWHGHSSSILDTEWRGILGRPLQLVDGRILSWGCDSCLRSWNPATGHSEEWRGHSGTVAGALSLTGGQVLSWDGDGGLRLWNSATVESVELRRPKKFAQLSEGQLLIWGDDDRLRLWNPAVTESYETADLVLWADGRLCLFNPNKYQIVVWRDYSNTLKLADGQVLSWGEGSDMRLCNPASGQSVEWRGHSKVYGALQLANEQVLSWGANGWRLWNPATGQSIEWPGRSIKRGPMPLTDGQVLIFGSSVRLWNPTTDQFVELNLGPVKDAMELDAQLLLWGRAGLHLWSPATGQSVELAAGAVDGATQLADGQVLHWGDDGSFHLWNPLTGQSVEWDGDFEQVRGVLSLADGQVLSWGMENGLRLWNAATGRSVELDPGPIKEVKKLDDGKVLFWGGSSLHLWNPAIGQSVQWHGHSGYVGGAMQLVDGRVLSWSYDELRIWNPAITDSGGWSGHSRGVRDALKLTDGQVLSWGYGGRLRLWSPATGQSVELDSGDVDSALLLADGQVLSWGYDGSLRLWNTAAARSVELDPGPIKDVRKLDDGKVLFWGGSSLHLWNPATGQSVELDSGQVDGAMQLADEQVLFWVGSSLHLWNPATGQSTEWQGHDGPVRGALQLADGRVLSWGRDDGLRLWNPAIGQYIVWKGHSVPYVLDGSEPGPVHEARQLADGRVLTWEWDHSFRLWNPKTGESVEWYPNVSSAMQLVDGRMLSWDWDGLYVWSLEAAESVEWHSEPILGALKLTDGRVLTWGRSMEWHAGRVHGAIQLSDGRILSWGDDDSLRLWTAAGEPLALWSQPHGSIDVVVEVSSSIIAVAAGGVVWMVRYSPQFLSGGNDPAADRLAGRRGQNRGHQNRAEPGGRTGDTRILPGQPC